MSNRTLYRISLSERSDLDFSSNKTGLLFSFSFSGNDVKQFYQEIFRSFSITDSCATKFLSCRIFPGQL